MNILWIILSALLSGGLAFLLSYIRSSQGLTSRLAKKLEELNRKELEVKSLEEQAHFAYTRATEFNAQISCLNNEIQAKTEQLNQISEGVMKAEDTIRTRLKKERKEWYE
jgi:peptidoglycan hydrolase CwlO-like protein